GEMLAVQGESGRPWMEILVKGSVILTTGCEDGEEEFLAEIKSGDALRGFDLLLESRYDFSATAQEDTLVLRLYRVHFTNWLGKKAELLRRAVEAKRLSGMVSRLSLFRDFSPAQMRLLVGKLKRRRADKGEVIIRQGDEGN
ncbi:MAG: cyclic nucleotide-binding domain-containing protein, partial [Planctomycetes bacterium]|nr:cyclic nucleotide-binding domain-containing protein [Planctomycetota bacterium]